MTHRSSRLQGMGRQASGDRHSFFEASIFTVQRKGGDPGPCGRTCGQQASLAIGQHCPAWTQAGQKGGALGQVLVLSLSIRCLSEISVGSCTSSPARRDAVKRGQPLAQSRVIAARMCWLFVGCRVPGPLTTPLLFMGFCCASAALLELCKSHRTWVGGEQLLGPRCSPSHLS